MKKAIPVIIFCSLIVFSVNAQQLVAGAKGGLNISRWRGDNVSSAVDSRITINFGGYMDLRFPGVLGPGEASIGAELLYSQQGLRVGSDVKQKLNYLMIPVLGKYFYKGGYVEFGPQIGILVKAKVIDKTQSPTFKDKNSDQFSTGDISLAMGGGYEWREFTFGVRYNLGLTKVGANDTPQSNAKAFNSVWMFNVSYKFISTDF